MSYDQTFNSLMSLPFEQLFKLDDVKKSPVDNNRVAVKVDKTLLSFDALGHPYLFTPDFEAFLDELSQARHPKFRIGLRISRDNNGVFEPRLLLNHDDLPFHIIEFDKNEFVHWLLEGQIHDEMKDDDTIERYIIK